jgi:hypothetical protein
VLEVSLDEPPLEPVLEVSLDEPPLEPVLEVSLVWLPPIIPEVKLLKAEPI